MKMKYKILSLVLMVFTFGQLRVSAKTILECSYDISDQPNISVDLSKVSPAFGAGVSLSPSSSKFDYNPKLYAKYDAKVTLNLEDDNIYYQITISDGREVSHSVLKDSDISVFAYSQMVKTYSCPKYVLISNDGDRGNISFDVHSLFYDVGAALKNNLTPMYYVLMLTREKRNMDNVCYYSISDEFLNEGYRTYSLYVDLDYSKQYYIKDTDNLEKAIQPLGKNLTSCPIGYKYETKPLRFTELNELPEKSPSVVYPYHLDANGNFVSDYLFQIKGEIVQYVSQLRDKYNSYDAKCTRGAVTKKDYEACYRVNHDDYSSISSRISELERLISFGLRSGLSDSSQEILDARDIIGKLKPIVGNSFLADDIAKRIIRNSYCKYKSNVDGTYFVVSKKAPGEIKWSNGEISFDIIDVKNSNPFKFTFAAYSDSSYSNEIS